VTRPPRGARAALLAAALGLAAGVASAQGPAVPRDEPEPQPEPGADQPEPAPSPAPFPAPPAPGPAPLDDLPDYGPPPEGERAAPASQPRRAIPPLVFKRTPHLKLTYQRFVDHRLGGEASPYHVMALTFFPLSTWVRLGCTARFGYEETHGKPSWFLDFLATAGLQLPEAARGFTPFVDFSVGPGLRLYTTFHNSMPSLQWTFGLDAGAEVYLSRRFFVTGALGWVRPVARIKQASVGHEMVDVYSDAFIFKLGIGF
jgi:hypothetical protein